MIRYEAGICMLLQIWHGSVFPGAFRLASASAALAFGPTLLASLGFETAVVLVEECQEINFTVYAGLTSLIGFLVVFRTSIAYSRFWSGATFLNQMNADWFEAASSLVAFCVGSKAEEGSVDLFKQTIVRLFSMLHALALVELESGHEEKHDEPDAQDTKVQGQVTNRKLNLIDPWILDSTSLEALVNCDTKVELVVHWIQKLVMINVQNGVICAPPPIVSRAFQELSNGTVKLHNAMTIAEIQFPFPYAQANLALLTVHWVLAPLAMVGVANNGFLAGVYCFSQTFILWSLYWTAVEIEDPFGDDANDLDLGVQQDKINSRLQMLIHHWAEVVPSCPRILDSGDSPKSNRMCFGSDDAPSVQRLVHMTDVFSFDKGKSKQSKFRKAAGKGRGSIHNFGDLDDPWNTVFDVVIDDDPLESAQTAAEGAPQEEARSRERSDAGSCGKPVQALEADNEMPRVHVTGQEVPGGQCPCLSTLSHQPGESSDMHEEIDFDGAREVVIHHITDA